MSLPHDIYPHIFDAIFAHVPYQSLRALRAASHALRDRVDATLVRYIAVRVPHDYEQAWPSMGHNVWAVFNGFQDVIPRTRWQGARVIANSVRVVDIITAKESTFISSAADYDPTVYYCWCDDRVASLFLEMLAPRLRHLELVRVRGLHGHPLYLEASRYVTFYPRVKHDPNRQGFEAYSTPAPTNIIHFRLACDGDCPEAFGRRQTLSVNCYTASPPNVFCFTNIGSRCPHRG